MKLRPYQSAMVEAIRECWTSGQRSVLGVLPTGGGKTETAIEIIRDEATPTNRVLVLTERKVLCRQWADRLRRHGVVDVGVLQAENTKRLWMPVIVGTVQSVASQVLKRGGALPDFRLIVVDEVHILHETHDRVLEAAPDAKVLGLTATPLREGLGLRFDTMVVGATIDELTKLGHLVPARYFAPAQEEIERALRSVSIRAGDFATNELSKAMRGKAIIGDVVGEWKRRGEDRQTIAFCVDKQHAVDLAAEFCAAGVAAEVVVDDTPDDERAAIFQRFDRCETRVLCSVSVVAIGFDSPIASCVIMARPTMSLSLYIQQGGRGLRPYPGKADCIVLDHAGNVLRHGLLEHFKPPPDLSQIDKAADKKRRTDRALSWVCRGCHAVNALTDDVCVECGMARFRSSSVVVLDGELRRVDHEPGDELPGPTVDDVLKFYLMARWHAHHKGLKDGFAFHLTARRFKFDDRTARRVIAWRWRDMEPLVPDDAAARWFRADLQRTRVVDRYRRGRANDRGRARTTGNGRDGYEPMPAAPAI